MDTVLPSEGLQRIQNVMVKCNDNSGIEVRDYAEVTIQGGKISRNGWGLFLVDDAKVILSDSAVFDNLGNGISLWDSTEATVTHSMVFGNGGNGIWIGEGGSAIVEDNWVSLNDGDGILLSDWATAKILYNTIVNNEGWGVAAYERPCHYTDKYF